MTETTAILARVLGGYTLIMGVGMLVRRRMALDILERLRNDPVLTFTMGMLALLFGLVVVSLHSVWSGPAAIIVSLAGWLALAEGTAIVLVPQRYIELVLPLLRPAWARVLWGVGAVLLGLWLLWTGL